MKGKKLIAVLALVTALAVAPTAWKWTHGHSKPIAGWTWDEASTGWTWD
mgnify:CR=1 FL=1